MICKKCSIYKDLSEFYFRNDTKKYRSICKSCIINRVKNYTIQNQDKIKQYQKVYHINNQDKIKRQRKEYFQRIYIHKGFHPFSTSYQLGHIPWHKGKRGVYTKETLEKMLRGRKGKKAYNYKPNIIKCFFCNKEFHRKKSHSERNKRNFCSRSCQSKWMKIIMNTPERKERMRQIGKNRIYTQEDRLKASKRFSGAKHPQWKGGITPINKRIRAGFLYKQWRKAVFERDNYTCQMCEKRSRKGMNIYLHPHHIKSFAKYPELRFEVSNGITLCKDCHLQLHKLLKNTMEVLKCSMQQYPQTMNS